MLDQFTLIVVLKFTAFGLFHSLASHERFKFYIEKIFGHFFLEYFWRLIYCSISLLMLKYWITDPLSLDRIVLIKYPRWIYNILAISFIAGMTMTYWAFIQIDFFEFWGVKQFSRGIKYLFTGVRAEKQKVAGVDRLVVKGIYHVVRHPMLGGGFLIAASYPPTRSTLLYLLMVFIYIVIGVYFEEKRLRKNLGQQYDDYCKEVGALFPKPKQFVNWVKILSNVFRTKLTSRT